MSDRDELKKRAQAILSEARKLTKEAAKLAEEGKFELDFMGATYIPCSAAGGALGEDDMTSEQREQLEENGIYPNEYQSFGDWWMPSSC